MVSQGDRSSQGPWAEDTGVLGGHGPHTTFTQNESIRGPSRPTVTMPQGKRRRKEHLKALTTDPRAVWVIHPQEEGTKRCQVQGIIFQMRKLKTRVADTYSRVWLMWGLSRGNSCHFYSTFWNATTSSYILTWSPVFLISIHSNECCYSVNILK